jgi:hypothetical protein
VRMLPRPLVSLSPSLLRMCMRMPTLTSHRMYQHRRKSLAILYTPCATGTSPPYTPCTVLHSTSCACFLRALGVHLSPHPLQRWRRVHLKTPGVTRAMDCLWNHGRYSASTFGSNGDRNVRTQEHGNTGTREQGGIIGNSM